MDERILRINELARKSREAGLTEEEHAEQQRLRNEYREAVKRNLSAMLDNIEIVEQIEEDL